MISYSLQSPRGPSLSRAALGCRFQGGLRSSMVAGRGRDVLGVAAGEAAAGKMADGKAGEEKPEKPQRAGAAGGEHNPSVAGYVGCSGPFFELPWVGGVGRGEKGGSGAHPARCWAHTSPGHARCGLLASGPTSPPCRGRAGHCSSPPGPSGGPASEEKGDGPQKGGPKSGWD